MDNPAWSNAPPGQTPHPWADTPHSDTTGYGQQAGGTLCQVFSPLWGICQWESKTVCATERFVQKYYVKEQKNQHTHELPWSVRFPLEVLTLVVSIPLSFLSLFPAFPVKMVVNWFVIKLCAFIISMNTIHFSNEYMKKVFTWILLMNFEWCIFRSITSFVW